MKVHVVHDFAHAQECTNCEPGDGHIDELRVAITLEGALPDDQPARSLERRQMPGTSDAGGREELIND